MERITKLTQIDNFVNIEFVAAGTFGEVYKVISNDNPWLALKVLKEKHQKYPSKVSSFRREFEVMSNFINIDQVLRYFEFHEEGKAIDEKGNEREVSYIVMEHCQQSLFDYVDSKKWLNEQEAMLIFTEVLQGLK